MLITREIQENATDVHMIMQVHDELIFEVPEDELDEVCAGIRFRMQHCAHLDVPLIVDVGIGDSWEAAH